MISDRTIYKALKLSRFRTFVLEHLGYGIDWTAERLTLGYWITYFIFVSTLLFTFVLFYDYFETLTPPFLLAPVHVNISQ